MQSTLKTLSVLALCGLCACQSPRKVAPAPVNQLPSALPPMPTAPMRSKSLVQTGPSKNLVHYKLEWQATGGPYTVEQSLDLRSWSVITNTVITAMALDVTKHQAAYYRVKAPSPEQVWLVWDPSSSTNVSGYNIYQGNTSGHYDTTINAGPLTMLPISVLPNLQYYFAATAYRWDGLESDLSAEATYNAGAWTAIVPARITSN